jgi:hypothetical protein
MFGHVCHVIYYMIQNYAFGLDTLGHCHKYLLFRLFYDLAIFHWLDVNSYLVF